MCVALLGDQMCVWRSEEIHCLLCDGIERVLSILRDRDALLEEAVHLVDRDTKCIPEEDTIRVISRVSYIYHHMNATYGLPKISLVIHGASIAGRRCSSQILACSASVGAFTNLVTHEDTPPSLKAHAAMRRACPEYPR
jgi:hypothetical protein